VCCFSPIAKHHLRETEQSRNSRQGKKEHSERLSLTHAALKDVAVIVKQVRSRSVRRFRRRDASRPSLTGGHSCARYRVPLLAVEPPPLAGGTGSQCSSSYCCAPSALAVVIARRHLPSTLSDPLPAAAGDGADWQGLWPQFTSLKVLDLSRNEIESLSGLADAPVSRRPIGLGVRTWKHQCADGCVIWCSWMLRALVTVVQAQLRQLYLDHNRLTSLVGLESALARESSPLYCGN
jgi:hypothetical protein